MTVNEVKVPVGYTEEILYQAVRKALKKPGLKINSVIILKRSLDARKKPELYYSLKVLVNEKMKEPGNPVKVTDRFPDPVCIIGSGPAGLFSALRLSEAGIKVHLFERGQKVEERKKTVSSFWENGLINPESNIQFGEGGAGTFSDGKLNTLIKDPGEYGRRILSYFVTFGADEEILYEAKPHIGTDFLEKIIINIRNRLLALGAVIHYKEKLVSIITDENRITGFRTVLYENGQKKEKSYKTSHLVLAIGHSSRDTYEMLLRSQVPLEKKSFAVGIRIEHPQEMITFDRYGSLDYEELGAAAYKVTAKSSSGRGVYSFCMCPGGYVVNASSEEKRLCINGMSYSGRNSKNANAAIVVQVTPEDFPDSSVLSGIEFQRRLEEAAYKEGEGCIPVQLYSEFRDGVKKEGFGEFTPEMKGAYKKADLNRILPKELSEALKEAIPKFGMEIKGFDRPDAILSCVEARTSSPVRILRNSEYESELKGLYPVGEGAGYAGGIMSAAIDGYKAAEIIAGKRGGTV